ncbi:hypothetical protein B0A48_15253 [Cryoendolithus antarcticus]|uniref:Metallo-beta-lactamase domain-containing protein n=1 Tax=Cryoendolithus antarcticus TaxID=1507870 RepID=A0A1V8SIN6_9PEZI|nr:hypothetical protein B0A48_15253 [Cryoendolithus antarcticus]
MSVEVRQLNADSTFLWKFRGPKSSGLPIGTSHDTVFTVLIDPWLVGECSYLHPGFQKSQHTLEPATASLADLKEDVNLILISQDKPDHCHRQTLCSLPRDKHVKILATAAAAKKIKSWQHFESKDITALPAFAAKQMEATLHRVSLPASDPTNLPGEITISHMPTRSDITGLHNALGITYRPPGCRTGATISKDDEPWHCPVHTISLLYTPHGVAPACVQPWLTHVLQRTGREPPLTALFHSLTEEINLPFLGGKVIAGASGGLELMKEVAARYWISSHDGEKENSGWSVKWLTTKRHSAADIEAKLEAGRIAGKVLALGNGGCTTLESGNEAHCSAA